MLLLVSEKGDRFVEFLPKSTFGAGLFSKVMNYWFSIIIASFISLSYLKTVINTVFSGVVSFI
jgi:hypothetical protein